MAKLSISLLGSFIATLDGQAAPSFRTSKIQALLIYLAFERDHARGVAPRRDAIMELLWPGMPDGSARQNLRQTLYLLRQAVPEVDGYSGELVPLLHSDRQVVQLNPEANIDVDIARFQALITADTTQDLEAAADLYRGEFLADFYLPDSNEFEAWAANYRSTSRNQALDLLETLWTRHMGRSRYDLAEQAARHQLEIDELRESGQRQLMEALARGGQQESALAQYQLCRDLLNNELGVEPALETQQLMAAIRDGKLDAVGSPTAVRGYELREAIGEGGFGIVYRAIQPTVEREVAIKAIRRRYADDPDFIRRFEAEAHLVARLESPHIVPLYDFWREPGGAFLVMRWMRGGSLADALESGAWSLQATLKLVDQIAEALETAHRQGIVHRDLKPANILLDETGNAYLTDFGIAKDLAAEHSLTATGALLGSPYYLTPEQLLNEPISPQTDIYSFGLILFYLLVGEKPFSEGSAAAIMQKQLNDPVPSAMARRPELPPTVDDVIQKATAKQSSLRFSAASELAEAFRTAILGQTGEQTAFPAAKRSVINPYKGLRPFEEADAGRFFGRQQLTEQLLVHLAENRFLAIVGPSGSGKSSVVKAGLMPAIRRGALAESENWFVTEMIPGTQPLEELEAALFRVAVNPPATILPQLREDERGLARAVKRILPPGDAEMLLLVDQFEELFTLVEDEERRRFFLNSLASAAADGRGRVRLILTLRADFYDRPLMYQAFGQLMREFTEAIAPPTRANLADAIRKPAEQAGVVVEDTLLKQMINDVYDRPGALPLLQYALTELFERHQNNQMVLADYEAIGGVSGALANRAEALFQTLNESAQTMARQLFMRLVTLGEGVKDTRRRVLRMELQTIQPAGIMTTADSQVELIDDIIDLYGRYRLLSFDRDPATRSPTVEVAHEALLTVWPRYWEWIEINRDGLRQQRRLNAWAAEWEEAARDPGLLLRGTRLDQIVGWNAETDLALSDSEAAILKASLTAREERLRQRQKSFSRLLAASARIQLNRDLELGILLASHALTTTYTPEAEDALHLALTYPPVEMTLRGHQKGVTDLMYNADGTRLATADRDGLVKIWDSGSGEELLTLSGHTADVAKFVFNADETRLATAGADSTAKVWDVETGEELWTLSGHTGWVFGVAFSQDGMRLATVAEDGLAKIWSLTSGDELLTLTGHTDWVNEVAFSPDGSRLVTASSDGTVKFWDTTTGQVLQTLSDHAAGVFGMAITPDWTRMVTESFDNSVKLWDLSTIGSEEGSYPLWTLDRKTENSNATRIAFTADGLRILALEEGGGVAEWEAASGQRLRNIPRVLLSAFTIAVSPDGDHLAAASESGIVRVCSLHKPREGLLRQYADPLYSVNFSADGSRLYIAASRDGVRILDVGYPGSSIFGQQLIALEASEGQKYYNVVPSPDGANIVISDSEGTVKLVDSNSWKERLTLSGHSGIVSGIAFSPVDSRLASTGYDDRLLKVWDTRTGEELLTVDGHTDSIFYVAFSPDGDFLVTTSSDYSARVWDAYTGRELHLLDHGTIVRGVAFSPDGRYLATGTNGAVVHIWDFKGCVETGTMQEVRQLSGHADALLGLSFSADGKYLATTSTDQTARVWDVATGHALLTLSGNDDWARDVAFSPDGSLLATAGRDGTLRIYLLNPDALLELAYTRVTRWFTPEECRQFLNSDTCPPAPWE